MFLEPCCINTQLNDLVNRLEKGTDKQEWVTTSGDVSMTMMLEAMTYLCSHTEVLIVLVVIEQTTIDKIKWMLTQKNNPIEHITLVTAGHNTKELSTALNEWIKEDRVTLCEYPVAYRAIAFTDEKRKITLHGSIFQENNFSQQLFTISVSDKDYKILASLTNHHKRFHKC